MNSFATKLRLILVLIGLGGGVLLAVRPATADDDVPCYRERRFGPYVTADPRATAPTLAQAVGSGLLPPYGWGWYGWGWYGGGWYGGGWYGGGYPGFWGSGYWGGSGFRYPSAYPYPYGYNGRFWFPNGPSVPNAPFGPGYWGGIPPMGYSPYFFQTPYGPGIAPGVDGAAHLGPYYW